MPADLVFLCIVGIISIIALIGGFMWRWRGGFIIPFLTGHKEPFSPKTLSALVQAILLPINIPTMIIIWLTNRIGMMVPHARHMVCGDFCKMPISWQQEKNDNCWPTNWLIPNYKDSDSLSYKLLIDFIGMSIISFVRLVIIYGTLLVSNIVATALGFSTLILTMHPIILLFSLFGGLVYITYKWMPRINTFNLSDDPDGSFDLYGTAWAEFLWGIFMQIGMILALSM